MGRAIQAGGWGGEAHWWGFKGPLMIPFWTERYWMFLKHRRPLSSSPSPEVPRTTWVGHLSGSSGIIWVHLPSHCRPDDHTSMEMTDHRFLRTEAEKMASLRVWLPVRVGDFLSSASYQATIDNGRLMAWILISRACWEHGSLRRTDKTDATEELWERTFVCPFWVYKPLRNYWPIDRCQSVTNSRLHVACNVN